jgi:plastocyanin
MSPSSEEDGKMKDWNKRVTALAAVAVGAGLLASSPVAAATKNVEATGDKTFVPANVTEAVGDSVHWFSTADGVDHTVTQDNGVFDTGALADAFNFTKKFSAGTYPYHCKKHGDQGMRGTVKVAPQTASAPAGLNFTVKWAASGTNTGNRFDVMYRVGSGAWKTWRNNTSARSLVFGKGGPVAVARGKSYSFKVRSGNGTGSIQSGFSPVKSFRAG